MGASKSWRRAEGEMIASITATAAVSHFAVRCIQPVSRRKVRLETILRSRHNTHVITTACFTVPFSCYVAMQVFHGLWFVLHDFICYKSSLFQIHWFLTTISWHSFLDDLACDISWSLTLFHDSEGRGNYYSGLTDLYRTDSLGETGYSCQIDFK
jgi:hypothetical protein